MPGVDQLARLLIVMGLFVAGIGALLLLVGKIPFLGRLPGDFFFQRDNVTVYFPLATGILLSIVLTLLLNLLFWRR